MSNGEVTTDQSAVTGVPFLRLRGLTKYFGGVRAVSDIDMALQLGEVVALVGDNGAGKSTLVKLISGIESPDQGTVEIDDRPVRMDSPRMAAAHGIHTVYQELSLCDNLDAVANLFLGRERTGSAMLGRRLRRSEMEQRAQKVLSSLSVSVRSLTTPVGRLSGGQRQGIAICRALLDDPKLVILDEPTAALGISQRAEVLQLIRRLRDAGCAVLVISHDLRDVQEVADRIFVLRLGRNVAKFTKGAYSTDDLVAAITGARESSVAMESAS